MDKKLKSLSDMKSFSDERIKYIRYFFQELKHLSFSSKLYEEISNRAVLFYSVLNDIELTNLIGFFMSEIKTENDQHKRLYFLIRYKSFDPARRNKILQFKCRFQYFLQLLQFLKKCYSQVEKIYDIYLLHC